jgi:outer membrane protein OmpA-like peptidoglycan-associated protein
MNAIKHKLALAVLAVSLAQGVSASEPLTEKQAENQHTYWGIGIGSVLGAVIAGPPGAAIGGTLGASIGWGKDRHDAFEDHQEASAEQEVTLKQHQQILENNLQTTELQLRAAKSKHAELLARLQALQAKQDDKSKELAFLEKLVSHYTQDIYFRIGQSSAPEDASERLTNLVELLKAYPDLQVTLKGYTDPSGSAKLNAALAEARVTSIKQLLQAQGIEDKRIIALAIGEVPVSPPQVTEIAVSQHALLEELDENTEGASVSVITPVKKRNPVLDRRVAIELSLPAQQEQTQDQILGQAQDHTLAQLAGDES